MTDKEKMEAGTAAEVNASDFRSVKLPTFWKDDPKLWFAMLEKEFLAYGVRSDVVKCASVLRHLDGNIIRVVADIISAPECEDSYRRIKEALIERLASSEETQLRQLLTGIELNGRKPTELLREMQLLAGAKVSASVLQTLWLQRLPTRVQELLAVVDDAALDKLAALADKMIERSSFPEVAAITESEPNTHRGTAPQDPEAAAEADSLRDVAPPAEEALIVTAKLRDQIIVFIIGSLESDHLNALSPAAGQNRTRVRSRKTKQVVASGDGC
ncbi:uncharacterized protein LOC143305606 [Osmia lignaria lignaria]|uniref:uncharacterized protein LOC143305606 n=1 Tax=Osmia lignaria lignaria TaxID=1437193 RepID=UPI00402BC885